MLKWNEKEVADYLGVEPSIMDDGYSHHFESSKDGLVLCMAVFQHNCDVMLELFRGGESHPLVRISLLGCTRIRCETQDADRFLEIEYSGRDDVVIPKPVKVFCRPRLWIEL